MLLRFKKRKKRIKIIILINSHIIIIIKKATMQIFILNQKTNTDLNNFCIKNNDCKKVIKIPYIYYLI